MVTPRHIYPSGTFEYITPYITSGTAHTSPAVFSHSMFLQFAVWLAYWHNKIAVMECLDGNPASASTTTNGLLWYCGQKPSCHVFCLERDCYLFEKAIASWKKSGCPHPPCNSHQKLARMGMVKDKMKPSFGIQFLVCTERENPCSCWQWAGIAESPKSICSQGLTCRGLKLRKRTQPRSFVLLLSLRKRKLLRLLRVETY